MMHEYCDGVIIKRVSNSAWASFQTRETAGFWNECV